MRFRHPLQIIKNFGLVLVLIGLIGAFLNIYRIESVMIMFSGLFLVAIYLVVTKKEYQEHERGYNRRLGEMDAEDEFRKRRW